MATSIQKRKAHSDAVEITKAAYSSSTSYSSDNVDNFLQKVYDKLVALQEDADKETD